MTGILEQISADIRANTDALNRIAAAMTGGAAIPQGTGSVANLAPTATMTAQQGASMMANAPPPPQGVTSEQLLQLIQPHIGNDTIKAELGNAMRAMGINGLPEVQPHQYGPLYQEFQRVLARFGIGGAAPQQTQNASII